MKLDTHKIQKPLQQNGILCYKPGLVGGHCIGVDPYYLTYKSKKLKYKPKIILAGRNVNDNMPNEIAKNVISNLAKKKKYQK